MILFHRPWPPVTLYRCIDTTNCNYGLDNPPDFKGEWKSKTVESKVPRIQYEPCEGNNESVTSEL